MKKWYTGGLIVLGLAVLSTSIGLSSCTPDPLQIDGISVVLPANVKQMRSFDFVHTLFELYPKSDVVVLAKVQSATATEVTYSISKLLAGESDVGEQYISSYSGEKPIVNEPYLLFIQKKDHENHLLFSEAGWLRVNGDAIFPSKDNSEGSLDQFIGFMTRMESEILLPPFFYYYRELEELVNGSDIIFIGKIKDIKNAQNTHFFMLTDDVQENVVSSSQTICFDVVRPIKGDPEGLISIMDSPAMLHNTIIAANLRSVSYSIDDAPLLEEGQTYLVFGNRNGAVPNIDAFFVNPIQGFVPILPTDYTQSVQTNAVFTFEQHIEDIIADIDGILGGQPYTTYEPESGNDEPINDSQPQPITNTDSQNE